MKEQGTFVAGLLDASSKAYAAGAIVRLQEGSEAGAQLVETWGFNALVADLQVRLQHLAAALAVGRPELFELDAEWLRATHLAREIDNDFLPAILKHLRIELSESLPPGMSQLALDYVDQALARLVAGETPPSAIVPSNEHHELANDFLGALLRGDWRAAEALVTNALDSGVSIADLHHDVIAVAQSEVGRLWQIGELGVGDEHLCSHIVAEMLNVLRARMPANSAQPDKTVLIASVAGNLHDIGARIVADHFEMHGWRSHFLGADMPQADIVRIVERLKPDVVALSVGMATGVRTASATIRQLRKAQPELIVLVGGHPFSRIPELWRDVGAHGFAPDAVRAVEAARELVGAA